MFSTCFNSDIIPFATSLPFENFFFKHLLFTLRIFKTPLVEDFEGVLPGNFKTVVTLGRVEDMRKHIEIIYRAVIGEVNNIDYIITMAPVKVY